ncbi:MAG: hypothetical protein K9N09_00410 [Candidatus Cloacimonetes bacterium]|nr:hypothetical protein [Candidatus Cloacimonadota bacterium]MCF7812923.1 hypothetical protein [Candidatus Cloacimonadota bacterium]MCF7867135.1 hypothetical protein [Candidatus Cloacimonadota bacterium]MCF7882545.1 hypothetical protein [Candidatus Cloacimonadota bacterium]
MRKKKWLLTIVLIVFMINITFFILVRSSYLNNTVQKKISAYLEENMKAKVNFGSFTFNDKQLKITDLELFSDDQFSLYIDQIYIEYNLPQLLISRFKSLHSIKSIKIFEPELELNLAPSNKESDTEFIIPDIVKYFKRLQIFDGKVNLEYKSKDLVLKKHIEKLDLRIINTKKSKIEISAVGTLNDSIWSSAILSKGEVSKLNIDLYDFALDSLYLSQVEAFQTKLDLDLNYVPDSLNFSGRMQDIYAGYSQKELEAKQIQFSGNEEDIDLSFTDLRIDQINIFAEASIANYNQDYRSIAAEVSSYGIPLSRYLPQIQGAVDMNATIVGQITNPSVDLEASSSQISISGQVLQDIQFSAGYKNNKLKWKLLNSTWQDNLLIGDGEYIIGKDLVFDLRAPRFLYQMGSNSFQCDLTGKIEYTDFLHVNLNTDNLMIKAGELEFPNCTLNAELLDQKFNANLKNDEENIIVNAYGKLDTLDLKADVRFKRIELSDYFSSLSLPIISGTSEVSYKNDIANLSSMLSAYDRDFGKLSGRVSSVAKIDFENQRSELKLKTFNAKYNYEPFSMNLQAAGSLDSLNVASFNINNEVFAEAWFKIKPEFLYDFKVSGEQIKLREIAKYFMNYAVYDELSGETTFEIKANNIQSGDIDGRVEINDFALGQMQRFNGFVNLSGNSTELQMTNSYLCCETEKFLDITSTIKLKPELQVEMNGKFDDVILDSLFTVNTVSGKLDGSFQYKLNNGRQRFDANLSGFDLQKKDFKIDSLKLSVSQLDELLMINNLQAKTKGKFIFQSNGAIGYNLFNSMIFPDSNTVNISFEGDLLDLLDSNSSDLRSGSSECTFSLDFGMLESGIFLKDGNFEIKKGTIQIKNQPAPIEKLSVEMKVDDNKLSIDKFKFEMGEGKAYISNEITNSGDDFRLGTLNLGRLLVRTNNTGLQIYIPGYNPKNSYINVIVTGRNTDYLEVNGPFDDLIIYGDLIFFNGDLVYPPNTENLLKLFNRVTAERKTSDEPTVLPLRLDLKLKLGENVRYVTYPIDVKLKQDGYIHLRYLEEKFQPADGLFVADEGSIDMFGTNLTLDFLQVELNQFRKGASINGTFFKRTSDGTMITLELFNDDTGTSNLGNLRFELNSDNPGDMITDILAKLRYNRSMDEISPAQRQTLLQDEVIQIAGLGLESAVLDPLISPVENSIRKLLRLDYFHLQTDLIQNLFATYSSEQKSELTYSEEQTEVDRFTSELFLNNLSVSAGKYLARKLFFDYEIRFQKEDDIAAEEYIGVFQDFTLRYDLPWKLRLSYRFSLLPFDEENEHQIGIERSFRF